MLKKTLKNFLIYNIFYGLFTNIKLTYVPG